MANLQNITDPLHHILKGITKNIEYDLFSHHISYPEMRILVILYNKAGEGCTQEEIAQILEIDRSNIGRAVLKLEQKKCIYKEKDEDDARISYIYLTDSGEKLKALVFKSNSKLMELLGEKLSAKEIDQLSFLLAKTAKCF